VLAELEQILKKMRNEIQDVREQNKKNSREKKNTMYAENTMYIAGLYKAMSIISDFIKDELDELDKWSDKEEKKLSN
jgi:cysteine sulfinate desulfinase/cysteine desulfurase-like protein|tara:strand:- start:238 stop:468 length:231 start_codon:yes stop_codon:yes gene_type:complete